MLEVKLLKYWRKLTKYTVHCTVTRLIKKKEKKLLQEHYQILDEPHLNTSLVVFHILDEAHSNTAPFVWRFLYQHTQNSKVRNYLRACLMYNREINEKKIQRERVRK